MAKTVDFDRYIGRLTVSAIRLTAMKIDGAVRNGFPDSDYHDRLRGETALGLGLGVLVADGTSEGGKRGRGCTANGEPILISGTADPKLAKQRELVGLAGDEIGRLRVEYQVGRTIEFENLGRFLEVRNNIAKGLGWALMEPELE